jgi:oxygen-independent coproporphyrinogen-3 oxidase
LEANPDDLTETNLQEFFNAGINRLSIGVQSFFDDDLAFMGRVHNAQESRNAILRASSIGFKNISIDLIYGLPGMSVNKWQENLNIAFSLPIQHLSCYGLTVEERTKLYKMVNEGSVFLPNDELVNEQFDTLGEVASNNNFSHYEISNLSKDGFHSQHNSSYWDDQPYLGIGPSAHSYNGKSRTWNLRSNSGYIQAINKNKSVKNEELLTDIQKYNEYLMTRLRTRKGIILEDISRISPNINIEDLKLELNKLIDENLAEQDGDRIYLNNEGWKLCDHITSKLFI